MSIHCKIDFLSVVNLVTLDQFRKEKALILTQFLAHPFPTVGMVSDFYLKTREPSETDTY